MILGLENERAVIAKAIQDNTPVLIIGDTGTGKTSLIKELAQASGATFRRLNLNGGTTADEFAGRYILDGKGGMLWINGVLIDAMIGGHWLLLDEINTAQPDVLFYLHSLLDDERTIVLAEKNGEMIKPHENFRLFATMNGGNDYSGTRELNKAFASRFGVVIQTSYPDSATEERIIAERYPTLSDEHGALLVRIANDLRKSYKEQQISYVCSTRDLLSCAKLLVNEPVITFNDAVKYGILNRLLKDTEEYTAVEDVLRLHIGDLGTGKVASVENMGKKLEEVTAKLDKCEDSFRTSLKDLLSLFNVDKAIPDYKKITLDSFDIAEVKTLLTDYALAKTANSKK